MSAVESVAFMSSMTGSTVPGSLYSHVLILLKTLFASALNFKIGLASLFSTVSSTAVLAATELKLPKIGSTAVADISGNCRRGAFQLVTARGGEHSSETHRSVRSICRDCATAAHPFLLYQFGLPHLLSVRCSSRAAHS